MILPVRPHGEKDEQLEREIVIAKAEIHAVNTDAQLEQAVEDLMRMAYGFALLRAEQAEQALKIAEMVRKDAEQQRDIARMSRLAMESVLNHAIKRAGEAEAKLAEGQ